MSTMHTKVSVNLGHWQSNLQHPNDHFNLPCSSCIFFSHNYCTFYQFYPAESEHGTFLWLHPDVPICHPLYHIWLVANTYDTEMFFLCLRSIFLWNYDNQIIFTILLWIHFLGKYWKYLAVELARGYNFPANTNTFLKRIIFWFLCEMKNMMCHGVIPYTKHVVLCWVFQKSGCTRNK